MSILAETKPQAGLLVLSSQSPVRVTKYRSSDSKDMVKFTFIQDIAQASWLFSVFVSLALGDPRTVFLPH